jgi:hypothetical protein
VAPTASHTFVQPETSVYQFVRSPNSAPPLPEFNGIEPKTTSLQYFLFEELHGSKQFTQLQRTF